MELVDISRRLKINAIVSEIVSLRDDLVVKGKAVNKCLKEMCMSKNVWFLEHANIIPDTHLNRSKLHLNQKGTTLLDSNFIHVFERI